MDDQICNRCLVQVDARVSLVALWSNSTGVNSDLAPNVTNTIALKKWIEERLYGDNARFELNQFTGAVKAVSTWHGDPVCMIHLRDCVTRETQGR